MPIPECFTGFEGISMTSPALGMQAMHVLPSVAILLCTYQGVKYLAEQLDSYSVQTHTNIQVWASDDGSTDGTLDILNTYQKKWPIGRLQVISGPSQGYATNFLSLNSNEDIQADFYAFSDQDDIWHADKVERAVKWLQSIPKDRPALYCSRTILVDEKNRVIGSSQYFRRPPSFSNALVQNIAGGNTMVFNNAARNLLIESTMNASVVIHDWCLYLLVSGCGGEIFYDSNPSLRYRQHGTNNVGANFGWRSKLKRIGMIISGQLIRWNDSNIALMKNMENKMSVESKTTLDIFSKARSEYVFKRIINIRRSGIYRQTLYGNIGIYVSAIFGKV
jgi:glycosyltransferase involved in cell wall biosynthesis